MRCIYGCYGLVCREALYHHAVVQNASCAMYAAAHANWLTVSILRR